MELFDVHVLGFEVSEERATRSLMHVFGLSEAAARIFVHSVPRVGKRRVTKETAERYIRALHGVGAVVECRLSTPTSEALAPSGTSLPAPAVSSFPGKVPHIMQDSFGIMAPVAYSPHMPQIPKAPRIPADLHAIRARKGPDSLAPHWRPSERGDRRQPSSPRAPAALDTELASPNPDALLIGSSRNDRPASPVAVAVSSPDEQATAHAAEGAVFDSDGQLGSPRPSVVPATDPEMPWYARPTHQLMLALLIIGLMTVAASAGVFETNASRLGRAFGRAGIDAGQYDRAVQFLGATDTEFQGLSKQEARRWVDQLTAAGAPDAWVINIGRHNGQRVGRVLLVELPSDAAKRKAIFEAHAKLAKPGQRTPQDHGQRFISLVF